MDSELHWAFFRDSQHSNQPQDLQHHLSMSFDLFGSGFCWYISRESGKESRKKSPMGPRFEHRKSQEAWVKIRRLFGGKFKPNLNLISANASTNHRDSFVNDSTDHNLEKSLMELRFEHRKSQEFRQLEFFLGKLLSDFSQLSTYLMEETGSLFDARASTDYFESFTAIIFRRKRTEGKDFQR